MIGCPHGAMERMALVNCPNQATDEQRVALLEIGQDAELLQDSGEQVDSTRTMFTRFASENNGFFSMCGAVSNMKGRERGGCFFTS